MYEAAGVYQVRFGFVRRDLLLIPACVVIALVGIFLARDNPIVGVGCVVLCAGYLFARLVTVASRRVALRVDGDGVMLGSMPPWPASRSARVPWPDIEAIVLWSQSGGAARVRYIGLRRREGAPALPGSMRSQRWSRIIRHLVPAGLPLQTALDSRPATFWRLDENRLAAAVERFAPRVELISFD